MSGRIATALLCALPHGPALAEGFDIGGTAQMGIVGGTTPEGDHRTRLLHDLDLTMRLSRTTDGGLTFALEVDLDDLLTDPVGPDPLRTRGFGE